MTDPTVPVPTQSNQGYPSGTGSGYPATGGYPATTTTGYDPEATVPQRTGQDVVAGAGSDSGSGTTREKVAEQGREVGQHVKEAGGDVARTAQQEGRRVAHEAVAQARDLVGEARGHLHGQARTQQQRAASGLRGIGEELRSMAGGSQQSGPATELARQASGRIDDLAGWLESREPGHLLEEVRGYARRHPVAFLAGAAALGVLAGRLTRGVAAVSGDNGGTGQHDVGTRPAASNYGAGAADLSGNGGAGYGGAGYGAAAPTPTYQEPVPGGGLYSSNTVGAGSGPAAGVGYEPTAPGGQRTTHAYESDAGLQGTGTGYQTGPAYGSGTDVTPLADETTYRPGEEGRRA